MPPDLPDDLKAFDAHVQRVAPALPDDLASFDAKVQSAAPPAQAPARYGPSGGPATKLSNDDERQFRAWYADASKKTGMDPNPDHPLHYYDMRGAWKSGVRDSVGGHWPSQFKEWRHPNRYVNGEDTITGEASPLATDRASQMEQFGSVAGEDLPPQQRLGMGEFNRQQQEATALQRQQQHAQMNPQLPASQPPQIQRPSAEHQQLGVSGNTFGGKIFTRLAAPFADAISGFGLFSDIAGGAIDALNKSQEVGAERPQTRTQATVEALSSAVGQILPLLIPGAGAKVVKGLGASEGAITATRTLLNPALAAGSAAGNAVPSALKAPASLAAYTATAGLGKSIFPPGGSKTGAGERAGSALMDALLSAPKMVVSMADGAIDALKAIADDHKISPMTIMRIGRDIEPLATIIAFGAAAKLFESNRARANTIADETTPTRAQVKGLFAVEGSNTTERGMLANMVRKIRTADAEAKAGESELQSWLSAPEMEQQGPTITKVAAVVKRSGAALDKAGISLKTFDAELKRLGSVQAVREKYDGQTDAPTYARARAAQMYFDGELPLEPEGSSNAAPARNPGQERPLAGGKNVPGAVSALAGGVPKMVEGQGTPTGNQPGNVAGEGPVTPTAVVSSPSSGPPNGLGGPATALPAAVQSTLGESGHFDPLGLARGIGNGIKQLFQRDSIPNLAKAGQSTSDAAYELSVSRGAAKKQARADVAEVVGPLNNILGRPKKSAVADMELLGSMGVMGRLRMKMRAALAAGNAALQALIRANMPMTDAEFAAKSADPKFKALRDKWVSGPQARIDAMHQQAQPGGTMEGPDENGMFVHMVAPDAAAASGTTQRGFLGALRKRSSDFARQASGAAKGGYETNILKIAEQSYAKDYPLSRLNNYIAAGVKDGALALVDLKQDAPPGWHYVDMREFQKFVEVDDAGDVTNSFMRGKKLYAKTDGIARETKLIAGTQDSPPPEGLMSKAGHLTTTGALVGIKEASSHFFHNILRPMLFTAGVGRTLPERIIKHLGLPGNLLITAETMAREVIGELRQDPESARIIAEINRMAAARPSGLETKPMAGMGPLTKFQHYVGVLLHHADTAMRMATYRAGKLQQGKGNVVGGDTGVRDTITTGGQYNRLLKPAALRWASDTSLGPFATTGFTSIREGARTMTMQPPAKPTSLFARAKLMADQATLLLTTIVGTPMAINMYTTGSQWGRPGTNLGEIDSGKDDESGQPQRYDLIGKLGLRPGAGVLGAQQIESVIKGHKSAETALGDYGKNFLRELTAPMAGPIVQAASIGMTGKDWPYERQVAPSVMPAEQNAALSKRLLHKQGLVNMLSMVGVNPLARAALSMTDTPQSKWGQALLESQMGDVLPQPRRTESQQADEEGVDRYMQAKNTLAKAFKTAKNLNESERWAFIRKAFSEIPSDLRHKFFSDKGPGTWLNSQIFGLKASAAQRKRGLVTTGQD